MRYTLYMTDQLLETLAPLFGRLCIGGYFVWRGIDEIVNLSSTTVFFVRLGMPQPTICAITIASIELLAGLALVVGWQTRAAAAFLIIYTSLISAIFFNATLPALFVANLSTIGGLLYVTTYGSGRFSISSATTRKHAHHHNIKRR